MVDATVSQHVRRHPDRPNSQLARFLMRHAGPLPAVPAQDPLVHALRRETQDREYTPEQRRTVNDMRRIWQVARGYFPGKEMPLPRFAHSAGGAVGWGQNPAGDPVPVGFKWSGGVRSADPVKRDEQLRTLLHEWAHNFQQPALYRDQRPIRPRVEGGAEAFAFAAAPAVAKALAQRYNRRGAREAMRIGGYRGYALKETKRGMPWIMRGQFQ